MPTYEYACTKCGQHVEVFQRVSDEPLTKCGVCGGPLRKVFHPAGILFKGSGFYSTDNRSKPSSGASGDGSKKSSEPSSEKKPAEKKAETKSSDGKSSSGDKGSSSSSSGSAKERSA